jgi:hypothetical protein
MSLYSKTIPPNWQSGTSQGATIIATTAGWSWRHDKGNGRFWDEPIVEFNGVTVGNGGVGQLDFSQNSSLIPLL